jgi:hypothetical protein
LWHGANPQVAHQHLCGLPHSLSECGEGELELSDLFDSHPTRHASGNHLDYFCRVLTEHVSANDLSPPGFDDQLAETVGVTIGDRSQ